MNEKQERFIDELVEYLVGNEVDMSIRLQMGKPEAKQWSKLRNATPLFGYYGGDSDGKQRAKRELAQFLGVE